MSNLSIKEKLKIVNSGGEIDETEEYGSWKDIKIRKSNKTGKVIKDMNGRFRKLTVRFEDNTEEIITMDNINSDPSKVHQYEWYDKQGKCWYRF